MAEKKSLEIIFHTMNGVGHLSACIGLAQELRNRGHKCHFLLNQIFTGSVAKYGFDEIIIQSKTQFGQMKAPTEGIEHPMIEMTEQIKKTGLFDKKPLIEKLTMFKRDNFMMMMMHEELVQMNEKLLEIIKQIKPDLFIFDGFVFHPTVLFSKIPWVLSFSIAPLMVYDSLELPPIYSGLPSDDQSGWNEWRKAFDETIRDNVQFFQLKILKHYGYDLMPDWNNNRVLIHSPYLNLYCYPKELDYSNQIQLPENLYHRIDAYCRQDPGPFKWPEEFAQKLKPDDKLIYLSMGTYASFDVDLLNKLINALSKTHYKCVVSKGPLHDQLKLGENMWGEAFVPQIAILPLVDMVITHGGNNTVTEALYFGKPMLVLPVFGDQPENAQRITELGYGDRIDPWNFTEQELIDKVDRILNDNEMVTKCQKTGERIRKSDSKQKACEKIEQLVANRTN